MKKEKVTFPILQCDQIPFKLHVNNMKLTSTTHQHSSPLLPKPTHLHSLLLLYSLSLHHMFTRKFSWEWKFQSVVKLLDQTSYGSKGTCSGAAYLFCSKGNLGVSQMWHKWALRSPVNQNRALMDIQVPEVLASSANLHLNMQGWTSIACLFQTPD